MVKTDYLQLVIHYNGCQLSIAIHAMQLSSCASYMANEDKNQEYCNTVHSFENLPILPVNTSDDIEGNHQYHTL